MLSCHWQEASPKRGSVGELPNEYSPFLHHARYAGSSGGARCLLRGMVIFRGSLFRIYYTFYYWLWGLCTIASRGKIWRQGHKTAPRGSIRLCHLHLHNNRFVRCLQCPPIGHSHLREQNRLGLCVSREWKWRWWRINGEKGLRSKSQQIWWHEQLKSHKSDTGNLP